MKKGFTLVELMVTVGILAILLTIVVVSAGGVMKAAREKRTEAMRIALEQGIATYYAQMSEWPKPIEDAIGSNADKDEFDLSESDTDAVFAEIVRKAYGKGKGLKSMMIDASALYVADKSTLKTPVEKRYCQQRHCGRGIDFSEVTKKSSKSRLSIGQMAFGYQCKEHGLFCRFKIRYDVKSDAVKVMIEKEE